MTTSTASSGRGTPRWRAVLWDLDGTLVDSEPLHRRTLYAVLAEVGCRHPPDLDALLVGLSIDEVHALLRERFGLTLALDDFARRRAALFVAQAHTVPARPGAMKIVAALSAGGVPQAIVSNSDGAIVRANVAAAGLDRYGMPVVSRDDVTEPKPNPEPYLSAARALGVEAGRCIVVEDSPTGAAAGIAAGCTVLAWTEPGSTLAFPPEAQRHESAEAVRAALDAFLARDETNFHGAWHMRLVEPVRCEVDARRGTLGGGSGRYEKRLSDLAGIYGNAQAFEALVREAGNPCVYAVEDLRPSADAGDIIFGVTRMIPGTVGDEYFVTRGHIHATANRPEIYYGESGRGLMLLESPEGKTRIVEIAARVVCYVPPYWIHRSVNVGNDDLVMTFAYPADSGQDYDIIARSGGMRQRIVRDGRDGWKAVANPHYRMRTADEVARVMATAG